MPEKSFVFLSYTSDMDQWPTGKSFRQAACDGIVEAGFVPRHMGHFPARSTTPADNDQQELAKCDIYVGILGFNYGTPVRDQPEWSHVQHEFYAAQKSGKKLLVFLLHDAAEGQPPLANPGGEHSARQLAFRQEVLNLNGRGLACNFFNTADELHHVVYRALQAPGDSPAVYSRVLDHTALRRVADWIEACREDKEDRLDHYVPPHYAVRSVGERRIAEDGYVRVAEEGDSADQELARLLTGRRRLCISDDSGAGKSVFTRRVLSFACTPAGQQAVFGGQPGMVLRFEPWKQDWPADLLIAIEQEVRSSSAAAGENVDPAAMTRWLLLEGRILLLFDGLDQVRNEKSIVAVSEFLTGPGRHCSAIITGRPYRVDQGRGNFLRSTDWEFARLEGFDDQQVTQYLTGFQVDEIFPNREQVRELLRIPSVLRIVREMLESGHRVESFRSRGELYYRACHQLVLDAGRRIELNFNHRRTRRVEEILASIAFAMMTLRLFGAATNQATQVRSVERAAGEICHGGISDDEWREVQEISRLTNRCILEGVDDESLSWQHRSMMEYYCGLHLARYAREQCLRQAVKFAGDPEWLWAWRFVIELPTETVDESVRTASLALLFRQPEQQRRPTELMYRAWPVLETRTAGRAVLVRFRDEYPARLIHSNALTQLESSFLHCPPLILKDVRRFWMGAGGDDLRMIHRGLPRIQLEVQSFLLLRAPVTVAQFSEFDARYVATETETLRRFATTDECPAIMLNWYDAWCFAAWSGSRLPREFEWEFACRAGTETYFWWGNDMDPKKCTFGTPPTSPADSAHANSWGITEMSGNVWEWCEDWFDGDLNWTIQQQFHGVERVLRGGSFGDKGATVIQLGCTYRYSFSPEHRFFDFGVRLARDEHKEFS